MTIEDMSAAVYQYCEIKRNLTGGCYGCPMEHALGEGENCFDDVDTIKLAYSTLWPGKALAAEQDMVNHPSHYNQGKYECIEVMEEVFGKEAVEHFCLLNAFKYVWRSGHKNGMEDLKKASFYLDYLEKMEEKKDD